MKDTLNTNNIKTLLLFIVVFVMCIAVVLFVGVLFGNTYYNPISTSYDRPVASMEYKDHRVDISDKWNMDVLPRG